MRSSIIRLLCGIALIAAASYKYFAVKQPTETGERQAIELFGKQFESDSTGLMLLYGGSIAVGLLLIISAFLLFKKASSES